MNAAPMNAGPMSAGSTLPSRGEDHASRRERALAAGIMEVACELRLVDVVDLIAFIRTENHPNIGDLVNSSAEIYFREGTLCYGWAARAELGWDGLPSIMLDMEFRNRRVTAFFNLVLQTRQAGVDLHHIAFDDASPDPARNTRLLAEAIEDARLHAGAAR